MVTLVNRNIGHQCGLYKWILSGWEQLPLTGRLWGGRVAFTIGENCMNRERPFSGKEAKRTAVRVETRER